jgi:(p)ppGpp synthase/HD superfamily hydrolase
MKELALQIVQAAFHDKVDKAGVPYIQHLERVHLPFLADEQLASIALLHDLLEDCPEWTAERLAQHFPERVVAAVVCLTKIEGEPYEAYLQRVASNPDARAVKIADLQDNIRLERLNRPPNAEDLARVEKYRKALVGITF